MGKDIKEKYERVCSIKDKAICLVETQMNGDISNVDAKELGEVVDIAKDMAELIKYCEEAEYYHKVTEAMDEGSKEENSYYLNKYIPEYEGKFYDPIVTGNRMRGSNGRYMYTEPYYRMPTVMTGYDDYNEKYRDRMYYSSMNNNSGSSSRGGTSTSGNNGSMNGGNYSYVGNGMGSRSSVSRRTYMDMKDADNVTKSEKLKEVMEDFIDEMDETFVEGHATAEEKKIAKQILVNYINSKLS